MKLCGLARMGWPAKTGALDADIITVNGDPLKDVKIMQHVACVMKAGVVSNNETSVK